ncbi:DUF131 domain-containing protein [Candidatus Woesearchaeota archaeon]|nr:DUF131 domain-containing protein [Candidatus Woesearchaeota archaeon]
MERLVTLGIILIFLGMIFVFVGSFAQLKTGSQEGNSKIAVGGFIGPIPFGFGNDKTLLTIVLVVSAILFIFWIIFGRFL